MKVSDFTTSSGSIDVDKDVTISSSNVKLSVGGNLRNRGEMRLEDTDVTIEGDLENDGIFSMNERKIILEIIKAMNSEKPNTRVINKHLAQLYNETNQSRFRSIMDWIKRNVSLKFRVGFEAGIPYVEFEVGTK